MPDKPCLIALRALIATGAAALVAGCVPPPPPQPVPLVVWPGQNKPYAVFQQDDAACRAAISASAQPSQRDANGAMATTAQVDPNTAYTQCMVSHGNVAQPAPTAPPSVAYGYPYPVYYGGPFVYGDPVFVQTWGWGGGWAGGWRGGWGYGYHHWR